MSRARIILLWLAAVFFIGGGINHFLNATFYDRIVPPMFPSRHLLVIISGIAEIAGGVGLLIPPLRRAAGWGLIALLVAVFPANIYMAVKSNQFADLHFPAWTLWARLPLQIVFIAWIWFVALAGRNRPA